MSSPEKLHARVTLNKQGRIVIPVALRHALGVKPGDELVARLEDDRIVLESLAAVEERLLSWFASIPSDVSLVDELIAERREEARRENEETAEWLRARQAQPS
jgi:AbrB family looped-hinge helix DNA binding protein